MSASNRLLKTCHHPKVPVTAPFLLLLAEISCVCVVLKKCRFCHGNKAVQRREARRREEPSLLLSPELPVYLQFPGGVLSAGTGVLHCETRKRVKEGCSDCVAGP